MKEAIRVPRIDIPQNHSIHISHVHTNKSDGLVSPRRLVEETAETGEKLFPGRYIFLGITDHDATRGLEEAIKATQSYPFVRIVPGIEVSAGKIYSQEHVLAYFDPSSSISVDMPIPHFKPTEWTLDELASRNARIIAPHPVVKIGTGALTLKRFADLRKQGFKIDGIETISPFTRADRSPIDKTDSIISILESMDAPLPELVLAASDSHYGKKDLVVCYNSFPGETYEDFFNSLDSGNMTPYMGIPSRVGLREIAIQGLYAFGPVVVERHTRGVRKTLANLFTP